MAGSISRNGGRGWARRGGNPMEEGVRCQHFIVRGLAQIFEVVKQ